MSQVETSANQRVRRAIEEIRAGRIVVLVDDEDRENEGDLVMAGSLVTPEGINFMARHGRGLICLAMTRERVERLKLPMMVDDNQSSRSTAFTVSIEAASGVSTGISAADRAHTVRVAVAPSARAGDLVSPGHIFPLRAQPGGVLQRTGHTEGSVDLSVLAGLEPAGVICEIMNEDGSMARMPDLERFAAKHGLCVVTIADLIEFRLQRERLVERVETAPVTLKSGITWQAHSYRTVHDGREFLALTLGSPDAEPVSVRMHTGSVLADIFGVRVKLRIDIEDVLRRMETEGRGVVVFIPPAEARIDLVGELSRHAGRVGPASVRPQSAEVLREYGLGAQVLRDLGLHKIRVLTNRPRRIVGLEGYGLEIVEQVSLVDDAPASTELDDVDEDVAEEARNAVKH